MYKLILLALTVVFFSAAPLADGQIFDAGGTITSKKGATGYYLQGLSPVVAITNYCSSQAACNASVRFDTGSTDGLDPLLIDNVSGPPTTLAAGGVFEVKGATGSGPDGLIFAATFTNALWTYIGTCTGTTSCGVKGGRYQWQLSGNVTGTVYLPGGEKKTDVGATASFTTLKTKTDQFLDGTGNIGIDDGEINF